MTKESLEAHLIITTWALNNLTREVHAAIKELQPVKEQAKKIAAKGNYGETITNVIKKIEEIL